MGKGMEISHSSKEKNRFKKSIQTMHHFVLFLPGKMVWGYHLLSVTLYFKQKEDLKDTSTY